MSVVDEHRHRGAERRDVGVPFDVQYLSTSALVSGGNGLEQCRLPATARPDDRGRERLGGVVRHLPEYPSGRGEHRLDRPRPTLRWVCHALKSVTERRALQVLGPQLTMHLHGPQAHPISTGVCHHPNGGTGVVATPLPTSVS